MQKLAYFIVIAATLGALSRWKLRSDEAWGLCAEFSQKNFEMVRIEGHWTIVKNGQRTSDPVLCRQKVCQAQAIDIFVPSKVASEREYRSGIGTFRCPVVNLNPSQKYFLRFFQRPRFYFNQFRVLDFQRDLNFVDRFAWEHRKTFPMVTAMVEAAWKGTTGGFDDDFVEFYRKAGLSHILAVSGQHVMILFLLMDKALALFFLLPWTLGLLPFLWLARLVLILSAAFLLWIYSPGNPPVFRSLLFIFTVLLFHFKKWKASPPQVVGSALALLLLIEPSLFASESFWLSASGAFFLSLSSGEKILKTYFWAILLIPFLMIPILCSIFGQLSLATPFLNLVFSPLWDMLLIPSSYLTAFLSGSEIGERILFPYFEQFLQFIAKCQSSLLPWVAQTQLVTLRINLCEAIVLQIALFLLVIYAVRLQLKED